MLLDIISNSWPRIIFGLYFMIVNTVLLKRVFKKENLAIKAVLLFIISCTFVSIFCEQLRMAVAEQFISPNLPPSTEEYQGVIFFAYFFFCDAISFVLPSYIFTKIIDEEWTIGATIYFIYVIVDRFATIVSISNETYLITVVFILFLSGLLMKASDVEKIARNAKYIEWRPMLHYLLGLFFLLESLYGGYYIFPEVVGNDVINVSSIWIDSIAVISTLFFGAFAKMNLKSSMNRAQKLEYMKKLQDNQYDIILKLTEISEAKSGETGQHVKRVSEYSAVLAKEIGLSPEDVECIRIASMMHDVGKLLIAKEIIEKPGPLDKDEIEQMKEHTTYGKELLIKSSGEVISMARIIAHEHHERWDGTGYPRGLEADEISIYAQIVSVADVYYALTSRRAYKEPWNREEAKKEIISQRGKQFSPRVVDAFISCYDRINHIQDEYGDENE